MAKQAMVKCTCEICGKEFFWKKPVTICQEKSTCRVLKHQRARAKEQREKRLNMLSIDAYIVMQEIARIAPSATPYIEAFLEKHGTETTEDMIAVLQAAFVKEGEK